MMANLKTADRVYAAINAGARTQREIRQKTKLLEDQVGDALAYLLLTAGTIRTVTHGSSRLYFPTTPRMVANEPRALRGGVNDSPLSFSTIRWLMPRVRSCRS
jgi:hypothetical protein